MRTVTAVLLICVLVTGAYAYRQHEWAIRLKNQLELTNKDDVELMGILTREEKQSLVMRFSARGEERIADWIAGH